MPFSFLSRLAHWMRRFRHRCGYGIHSPFAFAFVRDVVYEKGFFYAYESLPQRCHDVSSPLRMKDLHLLLRLANSQRPSVCLLCGITTQSAEAMWLKAGSCHTHYVDEETPWPASYDMAYVQGDWMPQAWKRLQQMGQGGMLLLHDIASTSERREAWKSLLGMPQSVVSFDLRDFGVIFYRPELQRQHYVVNYF